MSTEPKGSAENNRVNARPTRKRTRSEKGLVYDEMNKKTPKEGEPNLKSKKSERIAKPGVSRKIVFNDIEKVGISVNNNSSAFSTQRSRTNENKFKANSLKTDIKLRNSDKVLVGKVGLSTVKVSVGKVGLSTVNERTDDNIIDPCFRNVWRKEMLQETKRQEKRTVKFPKTRKIVKKVVVNSKSNGSKGYGRNNGKSVLQETEAMPQRQPRDGIDLTIDVDPEELDYVDNIEDPAELDQLMEDDPLVEALGNVAENTTDKDLSSASDLADDKILQLPCVKNLFNRFWDEKMKEISNSGNKGNNIREKKTDNGQKQKGASPLIKSPSDTTIYAPAINKKNM